MTRQTKSPRRLYYIDNLRIFLSLLVVAHHWALANGAPGDWYTGESNLGLFGTLVLTQFVATNQAFFMGFFFLISGYMVPGSYDRKGAKRFLKERFIRLGVPLLAYFFILSPLINYAADRLSGATMDGLLNYLSINSWAFSSGPLWFVMMLLIFGVVYHLFRLMIRRPVPRALSIGPMYFWIILILVLVTGLTYLIRIFFPVGDWLDVPLLGFQPAHTSQYIFCFSMGIVAYRWKILETITPAIWKKSLLAAQILILIVFPAMFLAGGEAVENELFMGGGSVFSFFLAFWEQLVAISMIIGLTGLFKSHFNRQNRLLKDLSRSSYAIYVFHGVVLVAVFLLFQNFHINSLHKFMVLLLPNLAFCYLLAKLILKIPGVGKVL